MVVEFKPLTTVLLMVMVLAIGAAFVFVGKMDVGIYWPTATGMAGSYMAGLVSKNPIGGG